MSIESTASDLSDPAWREIERLVEEIDQAARSATSSRQFYEVLLARTAAALGAASGRIWTITKRQLQLVAELKNQPLAAAIAHQLEQARIPDSLPAANLDGPRVTDFADETTSDSFQLVTQPLKRDGEPLAYLELVLAPSDELRARHLEPVLAAVGTIAEDFFRNRELQRLRAEASFANQLRDFNQNIHRSLDLHVVAFEIANETRRILEVDRVSVLQCRGTRWRAIAVSNLAAVNRRNRTISEMERLVAAVTAINAQLWHGVGSTTLPELDDHLGVFLDQSHSRIVGVIPLTSPAGPDAPSGGPNCGALVVENFTAAADDDLPERTETLAAASGLALSNAIQHSDLPFGSLVRIAQRCRSLVQPQRLPKTLLVMAGIAAVIVALAVIRVDFTIEAEGHLQPVVSRNIYAPLDGDITEVHVEHDASVDEGDTLLVIRSAELDLEFRRLAGERAGIQERLLAVESERIVRRSSDDRGRGVSSMTEEELRHRLASLDKQLAIVVAQRESLRLQSPIRGRILTWEADELLAARPVRRGQTLLRVADVEGAWLLKLHVADHESGYVLNAMRDADPPLRVEFALATDPGASHYGTVQQAARITSLDDQGQSVVEVTVRIDQPEGDFDPRPGADAFGKIHCGRRSLGFVWLRDLWEFIQAKILF